MLRRIAIRNLVIVRALDLEIGAGMTALTGETGAGKSILIDALGLALGDKADAALIRHGAEQAEVNVEFELEPASPALAWLSDNDLDADGECLLRRILVRNGRSRAYINGRPAPLAQLRALGDLLVDIHGQHAHQSLLRPAAQRSLLDDYAGLDAAVQAVSERFDAWRRSRDALAELRQASLDRANRLDFLAFQIDELDGVALAPDEITALEAEHARLAHAERLLGDASAVATALDGDDEPVHDVLTRCLHTVTELCRLDPALEPVRGLLDGALIQLDEAAGELRHYLDRVELDPARLAEIDSRLGRLHDAARKHRVAPAELAGLLDTLREEAATLVDADQRLAALESAVSTAAQAYGEAAAGLSAARAEAALRLGDTVSASMQRLGMTGGRFRIALDSDPERPAVHGVDRVQFRVAANPGQAEGALSEVASGGELSRLSLAIQVATADCAAVPTLIFDEVDVGIGGAVAEIVGQLLRRLGGRRQVLCVTHLAQVAAQAHRQLRVRKHSDGQTTETAIEALDATTRVSEIARMLGGVDITEQTLAHAEEMIRHAQGPASADPAPCTSTGTGTHPGLS